MTLAIVWSPEAIDDLQQIRAYIAEEDAAAARLVVQRVVARVTRQLPENPDSGRPGRVPGTRELVVRQTPFIVPYRVAAGRIEILRVYHGARLWPGML